MGTLARDKPVIPRVIFLTHLAPTKGDIDDRQQPSLPNRCVAGAWAFLAERLRAFRHHGIRPGPADQPWATRIDAPGFNYRLSDVHAALGTSQLMKLDRFVERSDNFQAGLKSLTESSVENGNRLAAQQLATDDRLSRFDGGALDPEDIIPRVVRSQAKLALK